MEVNEVKDKLSCEIKNLRKRSENSSLKPYELFEIACKNLKFPIELYYREDVSMIFLFSCQIVLINKFYINGKGETKEDSYNNAVIHFLEKLENNEKYFTDEINESIKSIDAYEDLIISCKQFFNGKLISKIYKMNYDTLKKELESHVKNKSIIPNKQLTETYRKIDKEIICSIFLNGDFLLQQGRGQTDTEALENAAKEFFISYDILPKEFSNPESSNQFDLKNVLGQLNNYLSEKHINTDYYANIRKFVENLKYKFEVKFNDGVTTVRINGSRVVEGRDQNEYISNINACKMLLKEIKKYHCTEQIGPRQHCISTNSNISTTSNDLQGEENVVCLENINRKLKNVAQAARIGWLSNETRDIWSIVNQCMKEQGIEVEPKYENSSGQITCSFCFKNQEFVTGSDKSRQLARTAAAKNFIDKFL